MTTRLQRVKVYWKLFTQEFPSCTYRAYILPGLDYGDVVYDNWSVADTNLLECNQTSAKRILGCLNATSSEDILNDVGLTPLHLRRHFHIIIAFLTHFFAPCFSFFSALAPSIHQICISVSS